ncbi:MAG: YfbU family protein [Alphaproteobacteria bacterium]|nr:YfbU family protein [Alphaproteobacteria bacterium]
MELTAAEALILIMLSDIHEKLNIRRKIDPKFVKLAIHDGNAWALDLRYGELLNTPQTSRADAVDIIKIMQMWSFLERSYERLSTSDKAHLGINVRFTGFDGREGTDYTETIRFIAEHMGRTFTRFRRRPLTSEGPSLQAQRKMLAVFEPLRPPGVGRLLSVTQIKEILDGAGKTDAL